MRKDRILVTGANGQIGTVLVRTLRKKYGENNVIASDITAPNDNSYPFESLDILDTRHLYALINQYRITQIYHLAAILSAKGEANPHLTWEINMEGLFNILEAARMHNLRVFFPSSIAVFGGPTPRKLTPQDTPMVPETVYGISKVAGEHWCNYYYKKFGVDVRSVRYPGIIGYESLPGGGTTDYAVEIYHKAAKRKPYKCFLREDTRLPMLYMPDAIRATLEIMEAPTDKLSVRTSYNLAGISITPEEITNAIQKHVPDFKVNYVPDFRQAIADSWSESIDERPAQKDWNWQIEYDLEAMTKDMLEHLLEQYRIKTVW
ncbi:MAG: NAD-dependent epimerase/dehydratase family protein [Bacteroidetes bacterium]|nr:NAD-dependent epimerase/dehydratase family protein [Bacteroidota bacterium]